MIKTFCDHCGKQITEIKDDNLLALDDLFYNSEKDIVVGQNCILCATCFEKRIKAHIALDMKFLRLERS